MMSSTFDTAHTKIHEGTLFTIGIGDHIYFYRSYIFKRNTYIKYIQPNGNETHLGRYDQYGMHFNKKYRHTRWTRRNQHIKALRELTDFLFGIIDKPDMLTFSTLASISDDTEMAQTMEMIQEARDDKDYFYRIGLD